MLSIVLQSAQLSGPKAVLFATWWVPYVQGCLPGLKAPGVLPTPSPRPKLKFDWTVLCLLLQRLARSGQVRRWDPSSLRLVVRDGCLDGVFGKKGAVHCASRQIRDVCVRQQEYRRQGNSRLTGGRQSSDEMSTFLILAASSTATQISVEVSHSHRYGRTHAAFP